MQNNDKKVLLRISNLKQYFPLKGGRFVKANDGITLDIYEGETFGLVGESGCGNAWPHHPPAVSPDLWPHHVLRPVP